MSRRPPKSPNRTAGDVDLREVAYAADGVAAAFEFAERVFAAGFDGPKNGPIAVTILQGMSVRDYTK